MDVSRSTFYYSLEPESEFNRMVICLLDEIHLKYPFYGSRRLKNALMDKQRSNREKRSGETNVFL